MSEFLPTLLPEGAPLVIDAFDEVAALYMGKGGVREIKRKILGLPEYREPGHENNAEHQWSVAIASKTLYYNRDALGINFGTNFDISRTVDIDLVHDCAEGQSPTGDVDAMNDDPVIQSAKKENEIAVFEAIELRARWLGWVAQAGVEAVKKKTPEAKFGSDVDSLLAMRIILKYAPHRWLGINGEITTREKHDKMALTRLQTPFGHTVYEEMGRDFDKEEARRQEERLEPLFPYTENYGEFMRMTELYKAFKGRKEWPKRELVVDWQWPPPGRVS